MDVIRIANSAEVEAIKDRSELTPTCSVYAFGPEGHADIAAFKMTPELDPVIFQEASDGRRRYMFVWALENGLRMSGLVPFYYFNVRASDKDWQRVVEHHGAENVSPEPFLRYRKRLTEQSQ
jgi:hypothetical protein